VNALSFGRGFDPKPSQDHLEAVLAALDPAKFGSRTVKGFNVARASWVELMVRVPTEAP